MEHWITQWAESHETDIRIAGAIIELANGDRQTAELIWQAPSDKDLQYIKAWVPESQHANASWGRSKLFDI